MNQSTTAGIRRYFMATTADGVIPASREAGTPVSLAEAVGRTIHHPTPCRKRWYDETAWSYFRMVYRVGEVLEDSKIAPATWPIRLWVVQPTGETGNWSPRHYPYRLLSHQVRVVEEVEAWQALGRHGKKVLHVIEQQIPELAPQWAEQWQAAPQALADQGLARQDLNYRAWSAVEDFAYTRRESAAQSAITALAGAAAHTALAGADHHQDAVDYAARRARGLAVQTQFTDRLRPFPWLRELLLGTDFDALQPAAA